MTTQTPPRVHIGSDAALLAHWQSLMGEGGFGCRTLWLIFLDAEDHTLPVIMPIEDLPPRPEEVRTENLMRLVVGLREDEPGLGVAMLLSRPGTDTKTPGDRAWAACLVRLAREHGVRMWPVHLATSDRVQVMAPDDLLGLW